MKDRDETGQGQHYQPGFAVILFAIAHLSQDWQLPLSALQPTPFPARLN